MRKIILIILAVIVAAVVGFFCWREFLVPTINFVADTTSSEAIHHFKVQRLYSAEVDMDAYNKSLESIINTTEYTEEEIFAAAIASGKPEFFPSFNLGLYPAEDKMRLDGFVDVEFLEEQTDRQFVMEKVSLETIITGGNLEIEGIEVSYPEDGEGGEIAKVHSPKQGAVDITNATAFRFIISGEEGTLTLRFVYNIKSDAFLSKTVLEDQLLEIHATVNLNAEGKTNVEFIAEPYSSLEELSGQE